MAGRSTYPDDLSSIERFLVAYGAALPFLPQLRPIVAAVRQAHDIEPPFDRQSLQYNLPNSRPSTLNQKGRRRAVAGALVHDTLMVLACGGAVAAVLRSPSDVLFDPAQADPYMLGASLLLGVPFAAEAGYLLWAVLFRRR